MLENHTMKACLNSGRQLHAEREHACLADPEVTATALDRSKMLQPPMTGLHRELTICAFRDLSHFANPRGRLLRAPFLSFPGSDSSYDPPHTTGVTRIRL